MDDGHAGAHNVLAQDGKSKLWTWRFFFVEQRRGLTILIAECRILLAETWDLVTHKGRRESNAEMSRETSEQKTEGSFRGLIPEDLDSQPSSLMYGFDIFCKFCAASLLWIPAHALSPTLGMVPTRRFVATNYALLAALQIVGFFLCFLLLKPIVGFILTGLPRSMSDPVEWSVIITVLAYICYCIACGVQLLYKREQIQDFIINHCSVISLPKSYQRRLMFKVFVTLWTITCLSEPLFALLTIIDNVRQPVILPQLDARLFALFRLASFQITILLLGACTLGVLIPLLTCFLIVASTRHLKDQFKKQLVRFRAASVHACEHGRQCRRRGPNPQLVALLDARTRSLVRDYSCDTLACDWPELERRDILREPRTSAQNHHVLESSGARACRLARDEFHNRTVTTSDRTITTSSLLFAYKNLIRYTSGLRVIIREHGKLFGGYHAVLILIHILLVIEWITAWLAEARTPTPLVSLGGPARGNGAGIEESQSLRRPAARSFGFLIVIRVCTFITLNIYTFFTCNCLGEQLHKMRARLFMLNINSARAALQSHPEQSCATLRPPPITVQDHGANLPSLSPPQVPELTSLSESHWQVRRTQAGGAANWHEHDLVWSLFDQLGALSRRANFKITTGVYYSKRCLLDIFGRSVSLLLLCLQVIDMYAYTRVSARQLPAASTNGATDS